MFAIFKQEMEVLDGSTKPTKRTKIQAGRHEMERIENPAGHAAKWLVLKGTKIGATEGSLRDWGDEYITFEE